MAQIITSFFSQRNTLSQNSNISVNTRKYATKHVAYDEFRSLKRDQHQAINNLVSCLSMRSPIASTLREIVNHSDAQGTTRISYSSLAKKLHCCAKTIQRHIAKLADLGIISKIKNGWKQTNTVTVLVVQNLNLNKKDKMSCDLNTLNLQDLSTKHLLDEREQFLNKQTKIPIQCNPPNPKKVDIEKILEDNLVSLPQKVANVVREKFKWAFSSRKIASPVSYLKKIIESIQTNKQEGIDMKIEDTQKNWAASQERALRANEKAVEYLKSQGITDPMLENSMSPIERYDASMAYRDKLAALVVQFQKQPSGARPTIDYPARPFARSHNGN